MAVQLPLCFDAPPPPEGRWLSGIAAVAEAAVSVPTAARVIRKRAEATKTPRNAELAIVQGLARRAEDISNEVLERLPHVAGLGELTAVLWDEAPPAGSGGRAPADATLRIRRLDAPEIAVPVNVKRCITAPRGDNAVAARTAWAVALTGSVAPETPITNLPRARLELRAGTRELAEGEYVLLVVSGSGDDIVWWTQGLIGAVREDGRLASGLHSQAERLRYWPAAGVLPDDLDIARVLAKEWAPPGDLDAVREQLVLLAENAGATAGQLGALARRLLATPDDDLLSSLLVAALGEG